MAEQEQKQDQQYYAQMQQQQQQALQNDNHSVILVTAGYDNTVRFWEALSGICSKTIKHPDSVNERRVSLNDASHTIFF
jgi:G protein beta subunit-like protein